MLESAEVIRLDNSWDKLVTFSEWAETGGVTESEIVRALHVGIPFFVVFCPSRA